MNLPAPSTFKPFAAVRPTATGNDPASPPLRAAGLGDASRYAAQPPGRHEQLVSQTQTWVAQTFFGTLLKQMRESPFKSDLFSGGQGGQAFGGLYDQHLAEHMARGAGSKLVNGIVRRIEANAAYRKQAVENAGRSDNRTDQRRHGSSDNARPARTHGSPALRA